MTGKLRIVLAATPSYREMVFAPESVARLEALGEIVLLDDPSDASALTAGSAPNGLLGVSAVVLTITVGLHLLVARASRRTSSV